MGVSCKSVALVLFVIVLFVQCGDGAKILVNPLSLGHNSRLRNMIKMAELLQADGHEVTLMSNSLVSHLDVHIHRPAVHRVVLFNAEGAAVFDVMSEELKEKISKLANPLNFLDFIWWMAPGFFKLCDVLLSNEEVMTTLQETDFDLMIFDIADLCSTVMKDALDKPAIMWSNYGPAYFRTAFYPEIPSFMCPSDGFSCLSDSMSFSERFDNFINLMIRNNYGMVQNFAGFNKLKQKHNITASTDVESVYHRSLILAMIDYSLEFPRPLPANVIPIPYLFKREARPLSDDIAGFLQRHPNKGVVYLGFGTLVDVFPEDKALIIASAFSKFDDHIFIWRNNGTAPKTLHKNTLMLEWAPQWDILVHQRTKLFITHCGISSTYETLISGVPFLAAPLFWDQDRNAAKLIQRAQSGISINYYDMTVDSLYAAIKHMLDNHQRYKSNAARAAQLANTHPVPPQEQFLWWVNYVLRTNGAQHLMSESVPKLHYLQYIMVDVLASGTIVLAAGVLMTVCVVKICKVQINAKK